MGRSSPSSGCGEAYKPHVPWQDVACNVRICCTSFHLKEASDDRICVQEEPGGRSLSLCSLCISLPQFQKGFPATPTRPFEPYVKECVGCDHLQMTTFFVSSSEEKLSTSFLAVHVWAFQPALGPTDPARIQSVHSSQVWNKQLFSLAAKFEQSEFVHSWTGTWLREIEDGVLLN